ncbi:hypothetical protein CFE70_008442 [Pyrenophora teres f. teres 0-1]
MLPISTVILRQVGYWAHALLPDDVRSSSTVAYAWWLQGRSNQTVQSASAMASRSRRRDWGLDQSPHEIACWKGVWAAGLLLLLLVLGTTPPSRSVTVDARGGFLGTGRALRRWDALLDLLESRCTSGNRGEG